MIFIPFLIPIQFLEHVFLYMGQTEHIAYIAALYCRIVAPSMLLYFIGFSYTNFASCHGVTHYALITLIISSAFHFCMSSFLCRYHDYKMHGIAIATFLHFVCRCLVPFVLIKRNKFFDESIIPFSDKDSWTGFGHIIRLGFVSIMLKVMGWWAFDVFTLLASQLSPTDIAA